MKPIPLEIKILYNAALVKKGVLMLPISLSLQEK